MRSGYPHGRSRRLRRGSHDAHRRGSDDCSRSVRPSIQHGRMRRATALAIRQEHPDQSTQAGLGRSLLVDPAPSRSHAPLHDLAVLNGRCYQGDQREHLRDEVWIRPAHARQSAPRAPTGIWSLRRVPAGPPLGARPPRGLHSMQQMCRHRGSTASRWAAPGPLLPSAALPTSWKMEAWLCFVCRTRSDLIAVR